MRRPSVVSRLHVRFPSGSGTRVVSEAAIKITALVLVPGGDLAESVSPGPS